MLGGMVRPAVPGRTGRPPRERRPRCWPGARRRRCTHRTLAVSWSRSSPGPGGAGDRGEDEPDPGAQPRRDRPPEGPSWPSGSGLSGVNLGPSQTGQTHGSPSVQDIAPLTAWAQQREHPWCYSACVGSNARLFGLIHPDLLHLRRSQVWSPLGPSAAGDALRSGSVRCGWRAPVSHWRRFPRGRVNSEQRPTAALCARAQPQK